MKNLQNTVILVIMLALVANTLYEKFATKPEPIVAEERYESESFHIEIPDSMDFCGEPVPLKEAFIRERLDLDLHVNTFYHTNTIMLLKRANRWFPPMRKILQEEQVPEDFLYVAAIESNLQNAISHANATGYWQFLKGTAEEMGLEVSEEVDERYDPIKSTRAACKYFKQAYRKFGSWTLVAASYNMGMKGLENQLERQKVKNYYDLDLNPETARYVFRILAVKEVMENSEKYQFKIPANTLYYQPKFKVLTITKTIPDLADFAIANNISYSALKYYNPWLRKNKLTVKGNKQYEILIPLEGGMEIYSED